MIVIRRMVDRRRAYTAIFLPGEPPKIFPTNDAEHARILQVYKQDRLHAGIINDFSELAFPTQPATPASTASTAPRAAPAPWPLAQSSRRVPAKKKIPSPRRPSSGSHLRLQPAPERPPHSHSG